MDWLGAATDQFGNNPALAPTGVEQTKTLGESLPTALQPHYNRIMDTPVTPGLPNVTPRGIAGFGAEVIEDPTMWGNPVKAGVKAAGRVGRGVLNAPEKAFDLGVRTLTNVPDWQLQLYKSDPKAARAAPDKETLYRLMKDKLYGSKGLITDVNKKRELSEIAKKDMETSFGDTRRRLEQSTIPKDEALKIASGMSAMKARLGSMSEEADQILSDSGLTFQRNHLRAALRQAGANIGDLIIGESTEAAIKQLMKYDERLRGMPTRFTAPQIRDLMRQIRADIDWGGGAGEFNSTANLAMKELTKMMSEALKSSHPEYAAKMAEMAKISENLEEMNRYFKDDAAALASVKAMENPDNNRGFLARRAVADQSRLMGDTSLLNQVNEAVANRVDLNELRQGRNYEKFAPEAFAEWNKAEEAKRLAEAQGIPEPTEAGMWGLLGDTHRADRKPYQSDELDAIESATGYPFSEDMRRRSSFEAFDKAGTHGARLVGLFGGIGGAAGAATGLPPWLTGGAGMLTGAAADKFGGKVARGVIDIAQPIGSPIKKFASDIASKWGTIANTKYAKMLDTAGNKSLQSAMLIHRALMNTDPEYAAIFEENAQ